MYNKLLEKALILEKQTEAQFDAKGTTDNVL
jgi:hypothetical protein